MIDQPLPRPVERLDILLFEGLLRHKSHVRLCTAVQIASASLVSFFRRTNGFTYCGAIIFTA
jgi:hypothetical protein